MTLTLAAATLTLAAATSVLLGRRRNVLTLRSGLDGHLVVISLMLPASALSLELGPVVLKRRSVIRKDQEELRELPWELVGRRTISYLQQKESIVEQLNSHK